MKLPLLDEVDILTEDVQIAEKEDLFGEIDALMDEPILAEVSEAMGRSPEELSEMAPELLLENEMNPREYAKYQALSVNEKQRLIHTLKTSEEYQEFARTIKQYEEIHAYSSAASGAVEAAGNVTAVLPEGEAISQILKAAKKTVDAFKKTYDQTSSFRISGNGDGQAQQQLEHKLAGIFSKGALVTIISTAFMPFIMLIGLVVMILVIFLGFLFSNQQVSPNTGIMPYYAQADYHTPFNGGTIASDGCGITSMAMVVSLYKGETITPPVLAQMAEADAGYNTVKSHKAINRFAEAYQLGDVKEMDGPAKSCCSKQKFNLEVIKESIDAGSPIIVSVTGGYYNPSGGGHYIALYGSGTNGVFVYDPGSRSKYKESIDKDGSDWSKVFANAKHIWIFEPYAASIVMGNSNTQTVWLTLKRAGFSDAAAAGVIGNMYQESSHGAADLRPSAESKTGSIGLLQWTGTRADALISLAKNRNGKWQDISVQMEYLLQELNSQSQWKWTSYAAKNYPGTDNISYEEYKQLDDPELAAEIFCAKFVRCNYEKSNMSYRKSQARQIMNVMQKP